MWLWLLAILFLPFSLALSPDSAESLAAPTYLGPRSDKEAAILWQLGKEAFVKHHYQNAVNHLERLVQRYPAHEGYLEAHLLLGHALLKLKRPDKAVAPLQYAVSSNNPGTIPIEGRILLGRAYLELKKFAEADLLMQEVRDLGKKRKDSDQPVSPTLLFEASLVEIRSLIKLGRPEEATSILDRLADQVTTLTVSKLKAETYHIQLELKLEDCSRLPTQSSLDEMQIQNQLGRRGTCLLEAMLFLQKILDTGEQEFSKLAVGQVDRSFESYHKVCLYPPASTKIPGSHAKRSPVQLRRYQSELSEALLRDFKKTTHTAIELLKNWKTGLSQPADRALNMLLNNLENSTGKRTWPQKRLNT